MSYARHEVHGVEGARANATHTTTTPHPLRKTQRPLPYHPPPVYIDHPHTTPECTKMHKPKTATNTPPRFRLRRLLLRSHRSCTWGGGEGGGGGGGGQASPPQPPNFPKSHDKADQTRPIPSSCRRATCTPHMRAHKVERDSPTKKNACRRWLVVTNHKMSSTAKILFLRRYGP